jgi:protein-disulfide isomerase
MATQSTVEHLTRSLRRTRIAAIALGAVAAFLGLALLATNVNGTGTPSADSSASSESTLASLADRRDGDPMAIGPVDAPVVIIEWSDYRCPFCAAFANDTLPQLRKQYIDTGKVRFEFRDLAIFGDQSVDAAVAARAAGEQGRYFAFAEALFAAAPEKGHPDMPAAKLIGFARDAGVPDITRFERDLRDADLRAAVQADTAKAQQLGANGTPFFVVGETPMSGAQPADVFRQVIDAELARAAA